jgi:hypothetical protein
LADPFAPPDALGRDDGLFPSADDGSWGSEPTRRTWPVVVGVLTLVVVMVGVVSIGTRLLSGLVRDVVPNNLGLPTPAGSAYIGDLAVAQCYQLARGDRTADTVSEVTVVTCTTPHDGQVYARTTPALSDSASDSEITDAADTECQARSSALAHSVWKVDGVSASFYTPVPEEWTTGNHVVACVIESAYTDGLTRSWMAR